MTGARYPDGSTVEYLYDRAGNLDRAIFSTGIVHTANYDDNGLLVSLTSSTGRKLKIGKDATGGLIFQKVGIQTRHQKVSVDRPPINTKRNALSASGSDITDNRITGLLIASTDWDSEISAPTDCDEIDNPSSIKDRNNTIVTNHHRMSGRCRNARTRWWRWRWRRCIS